MPQKINQKFCIQFFYPKPATAGVFFSDVWRASSVSPETQNPGSEISQHLHHPKETPMTGFWRPKRGSTDMAGGDFGSTKCSSGEISMNLQKWKLLVHRRELNISNEFKISWNNHGPSSANMFLLVCLNSSSFSLQCQKHNSDSGIRLVWPLCSCEENFWEIHVEIHSLQNLCVLPRWGPKRRWNLIYMIIHKRGWWKTWVEADHLHCYIVIWRCLSIHWVNWLGRF